jgi:hypothetical protein
LRSQADLSRRASLDEHGIPRLVTKAVIDLLEIIEVDIEQGQLETGSRVLKSGLQHVAQLEAVGETREFVETRHAFDLCLGKLPLGHVLDQNDDAMLGDGLDRDHEAATIRGGQVQRGAAARSKDAGTKLRQFLGLLARDHAPLDQLVHERTPIRPGGAGLRGQAAELAEAAV